jgi:hypothetical protein
MPIEIRPGTIAAKRSGNPIIIKNIPNAFIALPPFFTVKPFVNTETKRSLAALINAIPQTPRNFVSLLLPAKHSNCDLYAADLNVSMG